MSKNLLQEIYEATAKILFEGKNKDGNPIMKALVPFCQTGEETSNSRTYPQALMTKQIERVQNDIESGKFLGTSSHDAKLDNVSHIVNKCWLAKNGQGWMEMKIIPTTKGKNLMTIIKNGGSIGVSTRGFGTVKNGKVQDDYVLKGIDCVLDNAYEKGTFNKDSVFESMSFEDETKNNEGLERMKEEIKKQTKQEKSMIENLRFIFDQKQAEGSSETWENFLEKHENRARKIHGLSPKESKVKEKSRTPIMTRLLPKDFIFEALGSELTCTEMAKIHNENVDRQEKQAKFSTTTTEDERRLFQMFLSAGLDISEARKRVEEQRGRPKFKVKLSEKVKEAIAELMEQYGWDFNTAHQKLKDAEKERDSQRDKKEERRKEIREILERH